MSRILYLNEYLVTFVNTIIKILQFIHLQNKIMLIEIVFLTCLESMQVWGKRIFIELSYKDGSKMLCTSDVPVQQIAQAVGIADPFILVEFSRSELAFRLLNIARSSSIIHTNVNRGAFLFENHCSILMES